MKTILFVCFLAWGIADLHSQNLDIARHGFEDNPKHLVNINSKCFYVDEGSRGLAGLSSNGLLTFSLTLPGYAFNTLHRLIKTKDNCVAAIGTGIGCEVYNYLNNRNFITKVDTNGVVIFQTLIQFFYGNQIDKIKDFTQHSDSSYYIVSDSLLYHYTKAGSFASKIKTGLTGITSVLALSSGGLLISGKLNNIQKVLELSTVAAIVNQQNSLHIFTKLIQVPSGNIYGLSSLNTVVRLNSNLTYINISSATLNQTFKINDFTIKNDSLYITGNTTTANEPFYVITDTNFNLLYATLASTYKNIIPWGIAIDNHNRVNIITRDMSTLPGRLSSMTHYQFPINGNFISRRDIGVTGFSVISSLVGSPGAYGYCNLTATVKNFTSDTIKSFYLNYQGFFTFLCNKVSLHKLYNKIILPNSTVDVETGDFNFEIKSSINICLFTTVPNSSTDFNVENDSFCKVIGFTTGIEKEKIINNFNIFPNPFNYSLSIDSETEIKKLSLYNTLGSLAKELTVNTKTFSFDNSDLANGMYLLKIETEKGIQIKKVVKE